MKKVIIRKTEEIENWRRNINSEINFIPTMGNLHNGHIKLISTAKNENSNVNLVSIFINPLQFDNKLDLENYPKTIDNDVYPLSQTLGASTAAEQSALFFNNIVNENTTSSRQFIIHEVMGRNCGWLTAATAQKYRQRLQSKIFYNRNGLKKICWDIHAIYIPEQKINISSESKRLRTLMDSNDCVNVFLSEGAGLDNIISDLESSGTKIRKDAFGHVRLDEINPGQWYANKIADWTKAEKVLVQKSGYFARSAAPNKNDISLIDKVFVPFGPLIVKFEPSITIEDSFTTDDDVMESAAKTLTQIQFSVTI